MLHSMPGARAACISGVDGPARVTTIVRNIDTTMQIICKNCGKKENIERSVLKANQTWVCRGCGLEIDLEPVRDAAKAFDKRYGLVHRDGDEK